ncbi:MAG TPA: FAD-binding oxidoreductase [Casimicrobiaceae bacterium]|nr:FAD-binding oxidoreductase [Casimicrobiaceae bacterium]
MASRPNGTSRDVDVIVIGAGIIGAACALYLQRDGRSVAIVDPEEPGEKCSYGNSGSFGVGVIAPAGMPGMPWRIPRLLLDSSQPLFVDPTYAHRLLPWFGRFVRSCRPERVEAIAGARASLLGNTLAAYQTLFELADAQPLIRRSGMLFAYESAQSLRNAGAALGLARKHGVEVRELSGSEARALNPALAAHFEAAAHFPANVHTVNPSRLVKALASTCVARGGELRRATVRAIEPAAQSAQTVLTDRGPMRARDVVIAAGIWSRNLVSDLGLEVLMEAERGYHVMIPDPGIELAVPTMLCERSVVLTPMEQGLRITGIAEFCDPDAPLRPARAKLVLSHALACIPGLRADAYTTWVGPRPSTPDSLPVISRDPRHAHVYFAFGHGPSGLAMGGITGKLIAELVAGRETSVDVAPFSIQRFN